MTHFQLESKNLVVAFCHMKQSDHLVLSCPKKHKDDNLDGTKQQIPQKLPVTHDLFYQRSKILMLHKACAPFDIQKLFILFQIASGD